MLAIILGGVWTAFTYFNDRSTGNSSGNNNGATANGGVVANNITNSSIIIGEPKELDNSILRSKIIGNWGENHCDEVSYAFSIRDQAIQIESIKRPRGTPPYKFEGTILADNDSSLEVRGEKPDQAYGSSATISYDTNGVTERLEWKDHGPQKVPVVLNRCSE